jgi:hypothetical protein
MWSASSTTLTGTAGAGVTAGQPGGQRNAEPQRLAGAGLAPAEDVGAGQGIRQNGSLDGEGSRNARCGQCVGQRRRHAERRKSGAVRRVRRPGAPALAAQGRSTFDGLSCHEGRLPELRWPHLAAATSVGTSSLTERSTTGAPLMDTRH